VAVYLADEQDRTGRCRGPARLARHVLATQRVPEDMELALLLVDRDTIAA
jgi:probable rRNA maturation factor